MPAPPWQRRCDAPALGAPTLMHACRGTGSSPCSPLAAPPLTHRSGHANLDARVPGSRLLAVLPGTAAADAPLWARLDARVPAAGYWPCSPAAADAPLWARLDARVPGSRLLAVLPGTADARVPGSRLLAVLPGTAAACRAAGYLPCSPAPQPLTRPPWAPPASVQHPGLMARCTQHACAGSPGAPRRAACRALIAAARRHFSLSP